MPSHRPINRDPRQSASEPYFRTLYGDSNLLMRRGLNIRALSPQIPRLAQLVEHLTVVGKYADVCAADIRESPVQVRERGPFYALMRVVPHS